MLAFVVVLFTALTPGVLVTLPPRSSKLVVAATHGLLFAVVYHFTHHAAARMLSGREGMEHKCKEGEHWDTGAKKCVKTK